MDALIQGPGFLFKRVNFIPNFSHFPDNILRRFLPLRAKLTDGPAGLVAPSTQVRRPG